MSTMEQVEVGKYQPYPEYKDSGVEWLGDIPSNWSVYSLKRSVTGCTNGIWGYEPNGENDLIVLRVADFDRNKLRISDDKLTYRSISEKESRSRLLAKGDLLIEKSGGGDKTLVGCVVLFDKNFAAVTSNFVAKMSAHDGYHSGFLNYAFSHLYNGRINYPSIKQTTGIQNLDSESYLMERFCFPSYTEQCTIATFLDYEMARIDKLIAQQQRLIELLKEKRQAVISHAVTKGLNPDAPMKDSGVEWLGEVPEHWKKVTFKYLLAKTIDNRGRTPPVFDSGIPMLEAKQIDGEALFSSDDFYKFIDLHGHANFIRDDVQENDILFITVGTIGKTCLVPPNAEYVIVQNIVAFRCIQDKVEPSFLLFWLRSTSAKEAMISTNKDSILDSIKVSDFVQSRLFIPPTKEQKSIGQTLKLKLARMDSVSDKAQQAIQLMQERRTALISAAVTGKIDLRGWVAPTEEVSNG